MKQIATRHGALAYTDQGSGAPLVLLSANPGDHRDFDAIQPRLAQDFRVLAFDWPGYGQSPAPQPPSAASAMRFAEMLREAIEALALPPAIFLGNSVGGYAAARLAIDAPARVRALVLVSGGGFTPVNAITRTFCRIKGRESVTRWSNTLFAKTYLRRRNALVEEIIARAAGEQSSASAIAVNAAVWRSFNAPEHDLRARAKNIRAPTLLAYGRHDPVIPANKDGKCAAASIPGAALKIFDTGHMPFAEDAEGFLAVLLPFLDALAP